MSLTFFRFMFFILPLHYINSINSKITLIHVPKSFKIRYRHLRLQRHLSELPKKRYSVHYNIYLYAMKICQVTRSPGDFSHFNGLILFILIDIFKLYPNVPLSKPILSYLNKYEPKSKTLEKFYLAGDSLYFS